jgi:glycine/D-amino acid oxidase-like deaminating enzyme
MGGSIAVVGGGMFGVTAAVELSNSGFNVSLYEQKDDIIKATSGLNHWRLHRGYHYPQSDSTAEFALKAEPLFRDRYSDAVVENENHYYAIADESWVSIEEYTDFMQSHNLEYETVDLELVNDERVDEVFQVQESHVCVDTLREICWSELHQAGVSTRMNTKVSSIRELQEHEHFVLATYANLNNLIPEGHDLHRKYKFEVCEIPMISLPDRYIGNNIIVVYGPFMSVDPWGKTENFLMGDYHNMRHYSTTGYVPKIPDRYQKVLNTGLVEDSDLSNFDSFKKHGKKYLPGVSDAEHIGSFFTIRTILPDVEDTDARPTLINQSDDIMTIFGGKLATSVLTAKNVLHKAKTSWGT